MSFFEDNMPTTFMGRDNNNNPCYHVRNTNGLSADAMKSGVQDDTLFHSSLPYLQILEDTTFGSSGTYWSGTTRYVYFNFPSSIINYLNNKYLALVSIELSDSTIVNVPIGNNIEYWKWHYERWWVGSLQETHEDSNISVSPNTGFFFLDRYTSSDFTSGAKAYNNLTTSNGCGQVLTTGSRCLVYKSIHSNYNEQLTPVNCIIKVLNITASNSTINYSNINYNGDIKISHDGFFIGGNSILTGKGFLSLQSKNLYNGTWSNPCTYVGSSKITKSDLNNLGIIYNSYTDQYTITTDWSSGSYAHEKDVRLLYGDIPLIPSVPHYSGSTSNKRSYCTVSNPSTNFVTAYDNKLIVDSFSTTFIGNTNGCTFTKDNLYVNGLQLYNPNNSNLSIVYDKGSWYIPPSSINLTSKANNSEEVIGTFSVAKPNQTLGILYNISYFGSAYNTLNINNNGSNQANLAPQSMNSNENLGASLAILEVGQCIPIGTITSGLSEGRFGQSISMPSGAVYVYIGWAKNSYGGILYYLYRPDIYTVQLIRKYSNYYYVNIQKGLSTGYSSDSIDVYNIPGFTFNYIQMTTTSMG